MSRPWLPVILASFLLMLAACDGSPTEPENVVLNGKWAGEMPRTYPYGEDWSRIELEVQTVGVTITGTLTSRDGIVHPVTGGFESYGSYLNVGGLPQRTPCTLSLVVKRVRSSSIEGEVSGRCPNTILSTPFRLDRVG